MLQLSQKQLLGILAEVGVKDVEIVEADVDNFDMNPVLENIDNTRGGLLRPKWESEAGKKFQSEADGKALGSLKGALIRHTGLTAEDFTEAKTYPQMVELAFNHVKNQKPDVNKDFEAKMMEALTARDKEWEEKHNPVVEQFNNLKGEHSKRERIEALVSEFKGLPLSEKLNRNVAAADFDQHLNATYDVVVKDGKIQLLDKGTQIPAMKGSQALKIQDIAKDYFEPRDNWVTSMKEKSATDVTNTFATQQQPFMEGQQHPNASKYGEQLKAATAALAVQVG